VVGARADDAHLDAVLLIPASIAVNNVDAVPGVEVVDSTLAVDLPDLYEKRVLISRMVKLRGPRDPGICGEGMGRAGDRQWNPGAVDAGYDDSDRGSAGLGRSPATKR
jgi:hypothetical protein